MHNKKSKNWLQCIILYNHGNETQIYTTKYWILRKLGKKSTTNIDVNLLEHNTDPKRITDQGDEYWRSYEQYCHKLEVESVPETAMTV